MSLPRFSGEEERRRGEAEVRSDVRSSSRSEGEEARRRGEAEVRSDVPSPSRSEGEDQGGGATRSDSLPRYAALTTLPAFKQRVHTFMCETVPPSFTLTDRRFG
jgi:hypothetical protein